MDIRNAKNVAVTAAYRGGEVLHSYLGKVPQVAKKAAIDLVTEADLLAERAIIDTLHKRFPEHAILAEESGLHNRSDSYRWLVDPLGGTTNFTRQIPFFSISIALSVNGKVELGVVLNPTDGKLFTAVHGRGADLNGKPIRVSDTAIMADSLLATGFPYNFKESLEMIMTRFTSCLSAALGIRRLGSAALNLCYVACGRLDGFWQQNLQPWDTAAGMLIAREAGAGVTDFQGSPFDVEKKAILATNGRIHHQMIQLLTV